MHRAIEQLKTQPEFIIVDGNKFKPYKNIPYQTIVKGDSKYLSIAAASVLAKTHRDDLMKKLHAEFPQYGWDKNKAYATKEHRRALNEFGYSDYHRRSSDGLFAGQRFIFRSGGAINRCSLTV